MFTNKKMRTFKFFWPVLLAFHFQAAGQSEEFSDSTLIAAVISKYLHLDHYCDSAVLYFPGIHPDVTKAMPDKTSVLKFDRSSSLEIKGVCNPGSRKQIDAGVSWHRDNEQSYHWVKRGARPVETDTVILVRAIAKLVGTMGSIGNFMTCLLIPDQVNLFCSDKLAGYSSMERFDNEYYRGAECFSFRVWYRNEEGPLKSMPHPTMGAHILYSYDISYLVRKSDLMIVRYILSSYSNRGTSIQEAEIFPGKCGE